MPYDAESIDFKVRIRQLREFIDQLPPRDFSMHTWRCGTAACIGGWAETLFLGVGQYEDGWYIKLEHVADALGLDERVARVLFYMEGTEHGYSEVTQEHACWVLQHLEETGVVDWDGAFEALDE